MYDTYYISKKMTEAVYFLATGEGDARSRVDDAYHAFWIIREDNFPTHLQKIRNDIDKLITRLPGREGHKIPDNLSRMKNKTASKIAALILDLYYGMKEYEINENIY